MSTHATQVEAWEQIRAGADGSREDRRLRVMIVVAEGGNSKPGTDPLREVLEADADLVAQPCQGVADSPDFGART